jgi:sugar O-acyltransferase (sialic acid O-acetyltransferase NeuD family)
LAKVIIFGTGQTASVLCYYLTHDSPHEVVAFTVDGPHIGARALHDLPVVAFKDLETVYPPDDYDMMVAIGYSRINHLRAEKCDEAKRKGYRLLSYISSRASTWGDLIVGDNCVLMENTAIQPFVRIGDDVTIGPGTYVGHHSVIGDHCYLASQVDVSGDVTIESYCFLGANATIRDGITIAQESVIGANVAMMRSTGEREVYATPRPARLALPSNKLPKI